MKIGILGGTFNPIHRGHLKVAQVVLERFGLNRILFIPCNIPHLKTARGLVPARHRLEMVKRAIETKPYFTVSDIEIKRGGPSYSIDTVRYLKKIYPKEVEFYFILGSDTRKELPLWREIKTLKRLCRFIVVARPGVNEPVRARCLPITHGRQRPLWSLMSYLKGPVSNISSQEIRKRLTEGRPIKYLVPDKVAGYIKKYRLYQ